MRKEPHIPTLVALLILLVGMGASIFLLEKGSTFFSSAQISAQPNEVTIANITDTSFSVSWITENPVIGFIQYSQNSIIAVSQTAFDIRDGNKPVPRYTHFVTVTGAKQNTPYNIAIKSGKSNLTTQLSLRTGTTLFPPQEATQPAFGSLVDKNDNPVQEALVHASFEGSQTLSTLVSDGKWMLPLGSLRSTDGGRYFLASKSDQERIFFVGKNGSSIVTTTTENDSPLPLVRLGESYDFTKKTSRVGPIIAQAAQTFSATTGTIGTTFSILSPTAGMNIPSGKPAFKGTGVPSKQVILTITETPKPIVQNVTVNSASTWSWSPTIALSPGKHILSATSFTTTGLPVAKSVSFNIFKEGTQVLGDATPSASLTPSPTASPKASPSIVSSPIASLVPSPTASATSYNAGTTEPTILLLAVGVTIVLVGTIGFAKKLST